MILDQQEEQQEMQTCIKGVISRFLDKGFEGLQSVDLAVAITFIGFEEQFSRLTNISWRNQFEIRALEKINQAKFGVGWLSQQGGASNGELFKWVLKGEVTVLREVLKKDKALLQQVDSSKNNALHLACSHGLTAVAEFLLVQGIPMESRNKQMMTCLHMACRTGQMKTVESLLKRKADPQGIDSMHRLPLHHACLSGCPSLLLHLLHLFPSHLQRTDRLGRTPLHYAMLNATPKATDVIQVLLSLMQDLNISDSNGRSPLHMAVSLGLLRPVHFILKHCLRKLQSSFNDQDIHGNTILQNS